MDFIDEQHIAFLQIREQAGEIGGLFNGWPAGALEVGAHGLGDDVCERGLAQTGRAVEEDVVERFPALLRGLRRRFPAVP